jgi:hypothetical protein
LERLASNKQKDRLHNVSMDFKEIEKMRGSNQTKKCNQSRSKKFTFPKKPGGRWDPLGINSNSAALDRVCGAVSTHQNRRPGSSQEQIKRSRIRVTQANESHRATHSFSEKDLICKAYLVEFHQKQLHSGPDLGSYSVFQWWSLIMSIVVCT